MICARCGKSKSIRRFPVHKGRNGIRAKRCIDCMSEIGRIHREKKKKEKLWQEIGAT